MKIRSMMIRSPNGMYHIIINYVKKTGCMVDAALYRKNGTIVAVTDNPDVIKEWVGVVE